MFKFLIVFLALSLALPVQAEIVLSSQANQSPSSLRANDSAISGWGDSLTYGNQDFTGGNYPGYLQGYTNRLVNNWGYPSQNSTQILARFVNNPQSYNDYQVFWVGRNDALATPTTTLANIASMVAALPSGARYLIMSVINTQYEPSGSSAYTDLVAFNDTLEGLYPNNYIDIRTLLVNDYNPAFGPDVQNFSADLTPVSLRAVLGGGTSSAIGDVSTCSFTLTVTTTNGVLIHVGDIVLIDSEYIVINTVNGSGVVSACTRGYGSTAATHLIGAAFSAYDYLHLGFNGYQFVAQKVRDFINSNDPLAGSTSAFFPVDTDTNTRVGNQVLQANTVGYFNVGMGLQALTNNTTGSSNTAVGSGSMLTNTTGINNAAYGLNTMYFNTTGSSNTAVGVGSLENNTTASNNTAVGIFAGLGNTTGGSNTFIGTSAGFANTTGSFGTFLGFNAGVKNTTGILNTYLGYTAGNKVTTGARNTIVGNSVATTTLQTGSNNVLIGTTNGVDTPATSSSNMVNIENLVFYNTNSTAAPAATACGTVSLDSKANNRSGTLNITAGTPASCTVTFAGAGYTTWNHCRVTSQGVNATFGYSYSLTILTITGAALAGKIDYDCDGY